MLPKEQLPNALVLPAQPYADDAAFVLNQLRVQASAGLSTAEVEARVGQFGPNAIQSVEGKSAWRLFFAQFASLIVALLAGAALVALATGDWFDAGAIGLVLLLNALIGFFTEWQAEQALQALRKQAQTIARVRRDQHEIEVDAAALVPGDILILNAGDRVPADARILESAYLRVEESALTGESTTVEKSAAAVPANALLAERYSMLYLGTAIANGRTIAVVTATGTETELGKIGRLVAAAQEETTPLKIKLDELGQRLVYLVLVIGAIVMLAGWLRGDGFWLMLEVGISLAVAAVPEALPAVTTLILAFGVLRMAKQNAIVRRLAAVETLGSTTIICSDKTGTLTENRMTVREYHLADGRRIELPAAPVTHPPDSLLHKAMRIGVLCNEASLHTDNTGMLQTVGDPTETALLAAAQNFGLDIQAERDAFFKVNERPFDAETKHMITIHRTSANEGLALLKGAPNVVLEMCATYKDAAGNPQSLDAAQNETFLLENREMASRALRVLALAEKKVELSHAESLDAGYCFIGFVGMIDPPRAGVAAAIEQAHTAGIRVVMMTGDQVHTAQAIARELALRGDGEPRALHAQELAGADAATLAAHAAAVDVFARVSPTDKLNIVEALQQAGEIVAVTGDGVNDAPALKRANIGVAMGLRGTEVAKEAAHIVLADDNFATIVRAVETGRTIYANIIRFVHLMFSKNLGAVIAIFVSILLGWPLPLLPLQILWVNLVTDVFPAMALALEPTAPNVMQYPPRAAQTSLLPKSFLYLILWQGVMLAMLILVAYGWALGQYGAGAHARTVALFALIGGQVGHMFNCRSRIHSAFTGLFRNLYVWAAVLIVFALQYLSLTLPVLRRALGTTMLNNEDLIVIGLGTIIPIIMVECAKVWARRAKGIGAH